MIIIDSDNYAEHGIEASGFCVLQLLKKSEHVSKFRFIQLKRSAE